MGAVKLRRQFETEIFDCTIASYLLRVRLSDQISAQRQLVDHTPLQESLFLPFPAVLREF